MNGENENKSAGWREREMLGFAEVANVLTISSRTVRRLVAMGELPPPVKIRRSCRFLVKDIVVYVNGLENRGGIKHAVLHV